MLSRFSKIILFSFAISAISLSCSKDDDDTNNPSTPNPPGKLTLLSSENWFHYSISKNGQSQNITKKIEVRFAANGNYFQEKDSGGQWVETGQWAFQNSDSTRLAIFEGTSNEIVYQIASLTDKEMKVSYQEGSDSYVVVMRHNPPQITPVNDKFTMLTSVTWINKVISLNGNQITNNGQDPHKFDTDGTYKEGRDSNGDWKRIDTWEYANSDSTAVKIFVGQINEQLWQITDLTPTSLKIDYSSSNGLFKFEMQPE